MGTLVRIVGTASAKHRKIQQQKRKHSHSESVHCVVKRSSSGTCAAYDERKVYGSAYAACYVVLMHEQECERIAGTVAKKVSRFVHEKKEVQSAEIAKEVVRELRKHNKHAAFMYETHRDLS